MSDVTIDDHARLLSACRRALDWQQLSPAAYEAKYGTPDPRTKNTLGHVLIDALGYDPTEENIALSRKRERDES